MKKWRVPYPKFGAGPGLERVAAVSAHLGVDLAGFGVHGAVVVGSNGKGSTAAMAASLLRQTGRSVGLFTSPHLFALNERFAVDGEDISDDELAHHWARVEAAVRAAGCAETLGGFEFLFLIAAYWFAARGCAHTIWEAGIGGRLDPVRLIAARRLALTSLDFEHTALLGDTLSAIAREKVFAAPPGALLFAYEARADIEAHAREAGVRVRVPPPLDSAPLRGAFQGVNAALALALARDIAPLNDVQAQAGFEAVRWPGRLEVLQAAPLVVIDVGHTPAAIAAACEEFAALAGARKGVLICGASADKDVRAIVSALAAQFESVICAQARHKGASAAQVAAFAAAANPNAEIAIAESVADARRLALAKAHGEHGAVFVAGGLFLAAEFRAIHLGRDPNALEFF